MWRFGAEQPKEGLQYYCKLMIVPSEDKRFDKQFGIARLLFLILHLFAILNNLQDQTHNILINFAEIDSSSSEACVEMGKSFKAACTMALVFTVMQLIILYVGTNRFRVKSTTYILTLHVVGLWLYVGHSSWQFENIWPIVGVSSFLPTISQIAIALYTAKA